MMTGNIGRRGVGVNPLRGQNNVQGAADMGCQPHQGAGYFAVDNPEYSKLYDEFYGVHVPDVVGKKIPQMYDAMLAGTLKAMWLCGEDMGQTDPNTRSQPTIAFGSERGGFRDQARRETPRIASGYERGEQRSMIVKDPRAARRVIVGWLLSTCARPSARSSSSWCRSSS